MCVARAARPGKPGVKHRRYRPASWVKARRANRDEYPQAPSDPLCVSGRRTGSSPGRSARC